MGEGCTWHFSGKMGMGVVVTVVAMPRRAKWDATSAQWYAICRPIEA